MLDCIYLTLLIANSLGYKNVSGTNSIPLTTSAKSLPFFSLKTKAQGCLKCTDCRYQEFRNQDRIIDSSNTLQIFHQDIRGLRSKTDELIRSLEADNINPQVACSSEHHMEEQELLHLTLPGYISGSRFFHQNL